MPWTIDEEAFKKQTTLDVSAPQHQSGSPGHGIPVKQIPRMEFPKVVYKHPAEPFKQIEHRNTRHEVVHTEFVPAEHIYKVVQNEHELKAAMKDGWVKEPYVAPAPPDPNAHLYEAAK